MRTAVFALVNPGFAAQSVSMNPNWAEENLQTIRTLMERSAVYRRALAPIMLLAGVLGIAAAAIGLLFHLNAFSKFLTLWFSTAILAVVGALLIARRQAIRDNESFWSPPTRRVVQALIPALLAGMFLSVLPILAGHGQAPPECGFLSAIIWILFYGCALHSAGFFMPRGIKFFGWCFMASACGLFYVSFMNVIDTDFSAHWLMGFFFGVLHLAYGAYLYLTEKKNPVA
jgi:hypothetical protein